MSSDFLITWILFLMIIWSTAQVLVFKLIEYTMIAVMSLLILGLWIGHGATVQGVYDAHYLHMKQAESGALKRWQGEQKQISSEVDGNE